MKFSKLQVSGPASPYGFGRANPGKCGLAVTSAICVKSAPIKLCSAILLLLVALSPAYGQVYLEVDNGTGGSGQFSVSATSSSYTVYYDFGNTTGAAAYFGVLVWSASESNPAPTANLDWAVTYAATGTAVASGYLTPSGVKNGYADITLDFRSTPGSIPTGGNTAFALTLSTTETGSGSYSFKYTSGTLYEVPATGTLPTGNSRTTAPGGFSVTASYSPVPEPRATAWMAVAALGIAALASRFSRGAGRACLDVSDEMAKLDTGRNGLVPDPPQNWTSGMRLRRPPNYWSIHVANANTPNI